MTFCKGLVRRYWRMAFNLIPYLGSPTVYSFFPRMLLRQWGQRKGEEDDDAGYGDKGVGVVEDDDDASMELA